ncbi:MAG: FAD-binding oxidoreductase [Firmicutes bacterium]|nr:FAD-binding oxidoreductase [Bacillota bacterium]
MRWHPDFRPGFSYWEATDPSPEEIPDPLPARSEVVVIGAGFTGLSAALTLAEAGREVTVVDRGGIGAGASGRNGGQVLTGFSPDLADLEQRLGEKAAAAAWRLAWEARATIPHLAERYGFDAGWEQQGHVEAGVTAAAVARFRVEAETVARLGHHRLTVLDREALANQLGTPFYRGGLYDPASGAVHPLKLARGLARAARAAGARLVWPARVDSLEGGRAPRLQVATPAGAHTVHAAYVIVAVNAGLPWLLPELTGHIRPIQAWVIATAPLPPAVAATILPTGLTVSDNKRLMAYFRRMPDGTLVFGGRPSLWRRSPMNSWRLLGEAAEVLFPQARPLTVAYGWSGPIALSADGLPHLGRLQGGIWYAGGFSGHGVALSIAAGTALARDILGIEPLEETPWASFGPAPVLPRTWTWGLRDPFPD